jgi:hypothetical protein
LIKLQ